MSRALRIGSVSSHRLAARPSLPFAAAGAVVLSALPLAAVAAWQIDQSAYNAYLCQQVRVAQACMAPARTGNFASRAECESARSSGRMGSDWQWLSRTRCVERPDAAAAKPPAAPPPVAERSAPRDESTQRDAERFEQQRRELLAKLKSPDRGTAQPPATRSAGALRELQCAAGWALSAARAADKAQPAAHCSSRSAPALRVAGGCAVPRSGLLSFASSSRRCCSKRSASRWVDSSRGALRSATGGGAAGGLAAAASGRSTQRVRLSHCQSLPIRPLLRALSHSARDAKFPVRAGAMHACATRTCWHRYAL